MKLENMSGNKKTGKKWLEAVILGAALVLLTIWGVWQGSFYDYKIVVGGNVYPEAFVKAGGTYVISYLNQESIYLAFLSVVFSFLGNKEEVVSILNLILQLGGVLFFYLGARKILGSYITVVVTIVAAVVAGCFYSVMADTSMHILWFLTAFMFWICNQIFTEVTAKTLKWIILGILLGISAFVDFAGIFLIILYGSFMVTERENKCKSFLWFLISCIISFCILFCLWNNYQWNMTIFNRWILDRCSYFVTWEDVYRYSSLGSLMILFLISDFVVFSRKDDKEVKEIISDSCLETREEVTTKETSIQDTNKEDSAEETGKEEIVTEISKPIKFIENPLPLPKKHVKKEMNYAFEPTPDLMHYDFNNYTLDDDYDLKDI